MEQGASGLQSILGGKWNRSYEEGLIHSSSGEQEVGAEMSVQSSEMLHFLEAH